MQFQRRLSVISVFLLALLAGCPVRDSIVVHIPREELQAQLASRFPIEKRQLFLKAILSDPQILLKPGSDRIGVESKAMLQAAPDAAVTGRISLDAGLRYEPATGQLFLKDARLVEARIDTVPSKIAPALDKIGGMPTVQLLFNEICKQAAPKISDIKVGQLPDDWKGSATKSILRSVSVNGDGLDVEVGLPR